MAVATAVAHPNIALVKYWGKRNIPLNLPAVPSVSLTLAKYTTETTVHWGAGTQDRVFVDGAPASQTFSDRALHFLSKIDPNRPPCTIETTNNFPTAAGLASSSSGFAALALAALAASERTMTTTEASILARQGSGSACRSLWGGFVGWDLGNRIDGTDCHGYPIAGPDHWDVAMVMAIVSSGKKAIGSTEAMIRTAKTSPLYEPFVTQAPQDVVRATTAIHQKDLKTLGEIMESSTFKMHASMHAAVPPILYWKPATVACIQTVLELRNDGIPAYLTMDAGPNVKVLCMQKDAPNVQSALRQHVANCEVLTPEETPWYVFMGDTRTFVAPGKVVILGEYAVVDGGPALVAAVDSGVQCTATPHPQGFTIEAPDLKFVGPALEAWQDNAIRYRFAAFRPTPTRTKVGLGSSASATVAAILAGSTMNGITLTEAQLFTRAFEIHHRVQGSGSGLDIAASTYGGWIRFQGQSVVPASPHPFLIVWTGTSSKTGPRVQQYLSWSNRDSFLQKSARLVDQFAHNPIATLDEAYTTLCDMASHAGIAYDTQELRDISNIAREFGGAAKPSGAGGGDCAIVILPSKADCGSFMEQCSLRGYQTIQHSIATRASERTKCPS